MNLFKKIAPWIVKHEPEFLAGMGVSGLIFSIIYCGKATRDAVRIIDEYKKETGKDILTKKEIFENTWKCYVPVVISVGVSVPCIILGTRVSSKRNAALAAAYTLSESALQEYMDKTKEIVGPKKEQEIHEAVMKKPIDEIGSNQIILTGDGDSLFYEPLSGRYFKSNWSKILTAAAEFNQDMLRDFCNESSLNDWFYRIGLEETDMGRELGWNTDKILDISPVSHMTPDHIPCGAIHYNNRPILID